MRQSELQSIPDQPGFAPLKLVPPRIAATFHFFIADAALYVRGAKCARAIAAFVRTSGSMSFSS